MHRTLGGFAQVIATADDLDREYGRLARGSGFDERPLLIAVDLVLLGP